MDSATVLKVLRAANDATYVPQRPSGCGRAYVCVGTSDKKTVAALESACAALGLLFSRKGHYGVGRNSIYIGYDNADGKALAKSEAFAKVLKDHGLPAYADAAAD